jgi:hypothetical protein
MTAFWSRTGLFLILWGLVLAVLHVSSGWVSTPSPDSPNQSDNGRNLSLILWSLGLSLGLLLILYGIRFWHSLYKRPRWYRNHFPHLSSLTRLDQVPGFPVDPQADTPKTSLANQNWKKGLGRTVSLAARRRVLDGLGTLLARQQASLCISDADFQIWLEQELQQPGLELELLRLAALLQDRESWLENCHVFLNTTTLPQASARDWGRIYQEMPQNYPELLFALILKKSGIRRSRLSKSIEESRHAAIAQKVSARLTQDISLEEVDQMSGREFEDLLADLFVQAGFQVEKTAAGADQGADLIVLREGIRTAVQAKRSSRPVGNKAVQEVASARDHYNCQAAWVVTNNKFTRQARSLSESTGVRLMDRDELLALASR